ncbi:MAG: ribbon-helix-helix protein, CopG family [Chitinivibrionales bacterium]|nr:ribbon-helix-helix protein, CopG family [Chitinivibrionales bacterium]
MQLTIRIPDEYGEKINQLAQTTGLKKSDIARMAIKEYIERNLDGGQRKPYQKVRHLLGIAESGINDLGQRHRQHILNKINKSGQ